MTNKEYLVFPRPLPFGPHSTSAWTGVHFRLNWRPLPVDWTLAFTTQNTAPVHVVLRFMESKLIKTFMADIVNQRLRKIACRS